MGAVESFGKQRFHRLADELLACEAEELFGLNVDELNRAVDVGNTSDPISSTVCRPAQARMLLVNSWLP